MKSNRLKKEFHWNGLAMDLYSAAQRWPSFKFMVRSPILGSTNSLGNVWDQPQELWVYSKKTSCNQFPLWDCHVCLPRVFFKGCHAYASIFIESHSHVYAYMCIIYIYIYIPFKRDIPLHTSDNKDCRSCARPNEMQSFLAVHSELTLTKRQASLQLVQSGTNILKPSCTRGWFLHQICLISISCIKVRFNRWIIHLFWPNLWARARPTYTSYGFPISFPNPLAKTPTTCPCSTWNSPGRSRELEISSRICDFLVETMPCQTHRGHNESTNDTLRSQRSLEIMQR